MQTDKRARSRELCRQFAATGDPLGWFDPFYREAGDDPSRLVWASGQPFPRLVEWLNRHAVSGRALVPGCGLGDDAEELARRGPDVTAFDISPTAIDWCRRRFPSSRVEYATASLLDPPPEWTGAFDLIVELFTLQVIPAALRPKAMESLVRCLAPAGRLLIVCRGRDPEADPGEIPWPLTWDELTAFERLGLQQVESADFIDQEDPPVRRFLACYTRS